MTDLGLCLCVASLSGRVSLPQIITALRLQLVRCFLETLLHLGIARTSSALLSTSATLFMFHPFGVIYRSLLMLYLSVNLNMNCHVMTINSWHLMVILNSQFSILNSQLSTLNSQPPVSWWQRRGAGTGLLCRCRLAGCSRPPSWRYRRPPAPAPCARRGNTALCGSA